MINGTEARALLPGADSRTAGATHDGIAGVALPATGTPLFLVLGEGVNLRSRLESVDGDTCTVAAPLETTGRTVLEPGHELEIFWAEPRTRVVLPCRLVGLSDTLPLRWTLTPTAPARHENRREFVRGGGGAEVRLDTGAGGEPVPGALLDIGEGGLRCWVDEPMTVSRGDRIRATVWLGTDEAELSGTVHAVRVAPHGEPGQQLILTFDTRAEVARLIRQYVLAWEIDERRRAEG